MAKPDYLPQNLNHLIKGQYCCGLCGHLYPDKDLIIDRETKQLLCKNCSISMKELDQEQEDIEEMRREEMKVKSGLFEEE